jgi:hypothetical protein
VFVAVFILVAFLTYKSSSKKKKSGKRKTHSNNFLKPIPLMHQKRRA